MYPALAKQGTSRMPHATDFTFCTDQVMAFMVSDNHLDQFDKDMPYKMKQLYLSRGELFSFFRVYWFAPCITTSNLPSI